MREDSLLGVRVRVQRRWRRLRAAEMPNFRYALTQFRQVILDQPACRAVAEALDPVPTDTLNAALGGGVLTADTERDAASLGWALLSKLVEVTDPTALFNTCYRIAIGVRGPDLGGHKPSDSPALVTEHYLAPLFDYLDEAVDEQAELLGGLLRFQQWASWFGFNTLAEIIENEHRAVLAGQRERHQIEQLLQRRLFEWLFVDGLTLSEVTREPLTGVGKPDFHFLLHGQHIAAEVKLHGTFGNTTYGKPNLRDAVVQLLRYMDQYSCGVGYLIVFNGHPPGLRCVFPEHREGVPRLSVGGNRAIYVVVVAAVQAASASDARDRPVELQPADLHPGPS